VRAAASNLPSILLPAVASRLHDKPYVAESGGGGGGSFHLRRKYPEGGLLSRNHPRVLERKAPGRAPADGAAGTAFSRAGVWGQHPQLL
jgi:hypothetical protein